MNLAKFPDFFSAVTRHFIENEDFYEYFIRHGFNPDEWPECPAKSIATSFHKAVHAKSIAHARLYYSNQVDGLNGAALPADANAVIAAFTEFKEYGLYKQLGEAIAKDPKEARKLLANFKADFAPDVVTKDFAEELAAHLEAQAKPKSGVEKVVELPGWPIISKTISGFNPDRLILLVAGTGVGKTTLALNFALSAMSKMPVLYFNMEMGLSDVYDRLCMIGTEISSAQWNAFNTQATLERAGRFVTEVYSKEKLFITDGRALTLEQITSEVYKHKEKYGIRLVIVDYDQKIRTSYGGDEWQNLQRAVEDLEGVAKATQTCFIVLAQGNDDNMPKASARSVQPSAVLLAFYKDDYGKYVIEAKKNRFGPKGAKVEVDCDFERFLIKEAGHYITQAPPKKDPYAMAKR